MNKLLIGLHFLLTILAWTSFLYIHWYYIAIISLLHIAFLVINNGCFLSHMQFKDRESENTHFYEWWMGKLGLKNYNRRRLNIFMTYFVPLIIVSLAIILQEILKVIVPLI